MITVINSSMKNTTMNIRGMELVFDKDGVSEDVPFEIAKFIAPMHGFRILGMTDDQHEEAKAHVEAINVQRQVERDAGFVRGLGSEPKQIQHTFQTAIAPGRLPKSMQKPQEAPRPAQESVAKSEVVEEEETPVSPGKTGISIKGKKKAS